MLQYLYHWYKCMNRQLPIPRSNKPIRFWRHFKNKLHRNCYNFITSCLSFRLWQCANSTCWVYIQLTELHSCFNRATATPMKPISFDDVRTQCDYCWVTAYRSPIASSTVYHKIRRNSPGIVECETIFNFHAMAIIGNGLFWYCCSTVSWHSKLLWSEVQDYAGITLFFTSRIGLEYKNCKT